MVPDKAVIRKERRTCAERKMYAAWCVQCTSMMIDDIIFMFFDISLNESELVVCGITVLSSSNCMFSSYFVLFNN